MPSVSFPDFLRASLQQGPTNIVFEHGMYSLLEDLELLLRVFEEAAVPFELIGGVAVNAHLLAASERSRSFVTRDIDVLVRQADLPSIQAAASRFACSPKRIVGGYALVLPNSDLSEAVRLIFATEKPRSSYPVFTLDLAPEFIELFDKKIPVAPLRDLLITELNSMQPKDLVHLEILDETGLISSEMELQLPSALRERLQSARARFESDVLDEDESDSNFL